MVVGLFAGEKHFIRDGIEQDLRADGGWRSYFRRMFIETGVIPQALSTNQSCSTHVHIIQAEVGRPNSHHPDKGKAVIYVDCSSTAGPAFQGKDSEEFSSELSITLHKCFLL